jgi:hypothetical protein
VYTKYFLFTTVTNVLHETGLKSLFVVVGKPQCDNVSNLRFINPEQAAKLFVYGKLQTTTKMKILRPARM